MKLKTLITAFILTTISCASVSAKQADMEQTRGAAAGLVIGSIAGGPIGGFAGTILGGEVFGRLFAQRRQNKMLSLKLTQLETDLKTEREDSQRLVAELNRDLDKLLDLQTIQVKSRSLPLQFRTASSDIEPQYQRELNNIAKILHHNHEARVNLWGYTDRRGDETYNQKLSAQRITAIENYLVQHGTAREQILSIAYGESQPQDKLETLEGNFFDRRVVIELSVDFDPQLATR